MRRATSSRRGISMKTEPQTPAKILIVDDDKMSLRILADLLGPTYSVLPAESGTEALHQAQHGQPDLILLDIILPDLSGFEVLERLKLQESTRHIPVIFITSLDGIEDEEKGLFLGAVDYIKKPFHSSIIKARVRTHLQIVRQMRTIERLGTIDPLTELPNRRFFYNRIETEWARAIREKSPIALLEIDVDHFKVYNDTYGHPQGDTFLQGLAQIFRESLLRPTDFAARTGGEEFSVILSKTDLPGALRIGERIRSNVEKATIINHSDGSPTSSTVSIGVVSHSPRIGDTFDTLINASDQALYKAKTEGRNCVRSLSL